MDVAEGADDGRPARRAGDQEQHPGADRDGDAGQPQRTAVQALEQVAVRALGRAVRDPP
jgi:hypothetical protein